MSISLLSQETNVWQSSTRRCQLKPSPGYWLQIQSRLTTSGFKGQPDPELGAAHGQLMGSSSNNAGLHITSSACYCSAHRQFHANHNQIIGFKAINQHHTDLYKWNWHGRNPFHLSLESFPEGFLGLDLKKPGYIRNLTSKTFWIELQQKRKASQSGLPWAKTDFSYLT